jgi:alkanesulfonate monooxygenase SsuD/methylene tetrahydromethanopterin reductase-like flavin-dependent oxidoreductase (luciferase family)
MRHGLYLPNQGDFADIRRLAGVAEASGWDGVFLWDALLSTPFFDPKGPTADPFIALTAIALATERIRIGALVSPVARLRPEVFASQIGRSTDFAWATRAWGWSGRPRLPVPGIRHETDARARAAIVDEFIDLLVMLWSGRRVHFTGQHFKALDVSLRAPVQQPTIPIWIGGVAGRPAPMRARCSLGRLRADTPQLARQDRLLRRLRAGLLPAISPGHGRDLRRRCLK